jgi:hypothetical protein
MAGALRLSRWWLVGAVTAAALGVMSWGCAAEQARSRAPRSLPVPEVGSASLSTDGQVIALEGPLDTKSTESLYFIDATTGEPIGSRTAGTTFFGPPAWGPGNSYLAPASQLRPGELHRVLYWSPAAAEAPRRLDSTTTLWLGEASLDPTLQYAIVSAITAARSPADVQASKVLAVRLHGDLPPQVLLHAPYLVQAAGALADPKDPSHSLAFLLGPREGPGAEPGIVAVEVASGNVRWHTGFDVSVATARVFELSPGRAALVVARLDTSGEKPSARTEIWALGTSDGKLSLVTELPFGLRFAVPVKDGSGHALLFVGGGLGFWRIDLSSSSPKAEKVIEASREVQPVGARLNASGQVELFMYSAHAIWRCRPDSGACEVVLGQPRADEARPEFVDKTK